MSAAGIRLALAFVALSLVLAGLFWLFCRISVDLGWQRILALMKDPPFALILAGGLLCLVGLLYRFAEFWLLTHP